MSLLSRYILRLARKRWLFRAFRKRRELRAVARRTDAIATGDLLVFTTLRNERVRLPFFLRYYRDLGVNHFLISGAAGRCLALDHQAQLQAVALWGGLADLAADAICRRALDAGRRSG